MLCCYLALAALLTTPSCHALRQPPRMQALLKTQSSNALRQPPRLQAIQRRATAAPALAFLAALAVRPATALPPPEGCKWTGEGEYPGRKSGMDVKLINANLDCNENFVKGFGVSEFIVTPAILGLAAVLANVRKE